MILVTGASGFIGKALIEGLGDRALGLQRTSVADNPYIFECDLTDENSVSTTIENLKDFQISHIVHTAAVTPWSKDLDFSQDLTMAESVRRLCVELEVPNLIFISGWNVYDMTQGQPPFSEDTPVNPLDDYAKSKYSVEQYFERSSGDTTCLFLRTATIYGAGQVSSGLIPNLVDAADHKSELILKSLHTKRDYLYISDLVASIVSLVDSEKLEGGILNIGSGKSLSVLEVAETIQSIWQEKYHTVVEIKHEELQDSIPLDNQLNIQKARSLGLLRETRSFKDGLLDYVEWKKK